MEPDLVRRERAGDVVVLTLANPGRRNALSHDLIQALDAALVEAAATGCRALVLRAEPGVATWCSGHDISELPSADAETYVNPLEALFRRIRSAPFPVIAAVEGGVWGGGCNLVMACDLLVAMRESTFAITPARLGVPYDAAGVGHFLHALPTNVAREMFYTADPVSAERLHELGVVNRLVDDQTELTHTALGLAARIAERAPLSVRAIKAQIANQTGGPEQDVQGLATAAWRSKDYREGLRAFAEKRPPAFTGE